MDPDGQLRNLRDFLLVYNRMTEICFQRCSSNFNYRNLTMDEERCADSCASKLIRTNHRLMGTYVQLMPAMVQKRMQEMEIKAAEVAKAEGAAQEGASALENPSAVMTDLQPLPLSTPGIPAASSPVEILETPPRASALSEIQTSPLVPEPVTANLPDGVSPVTNDAQTFTANSLQGQINVTPVMSTSPNAGVGSISSAVAGIPLDKLKLSDTTATSVSETRSTRGAGQNSQTSS